MPSYFKFNMCKFFEKKEKKRWRTEITLTKIKLSRNCKSANLSDQQNGSQQQVQILKELCFSFKRKRTAWNKRKDKTMALDTQVNFVESGKGSFYIKRMVRGVEE